MTAPLMEAALAPQLFIQLTPKAAWYRPSILGQGSECNYNETLLSGTLALSIQYVLNVAQAIAVNVSQVGTDLFLYFCKYFSQTLPMPIFQK